MFCTKCGTNMGDGRFCPACGAKAVTDDDTGIKDAAASAETPVKSEQSQPAANAGAQIAVNAGVRPSISEGAGPVASEKEKKKGNRIAGIILAVVLLLVAVPSVAYYCLYVMPVKKFRAALSEDDFKTVNEYYDKVKSRDDREAAKELMLIHAGDVKDDYIEDKISYEDVLDEYDVLKEKVLSDSKEIGEYEEQIGKLKGSREAFSEAEKQFGEGDFLKAMESYRKVIPEDEKFFSKALEGIKKCDEGLMEPVLGKWKCTIDLSGDNTDYDFGEDVDMSALNTSLDYIIEFKKDGIAVVDVDTDSFNRYVDDMVEFTADMELRELYDAGLTDSEIRTYLKEYYGTESFAEVIRQDVDSDELLEEMRGEWETSVIEFTVEDGIFHWNDIEVNVSIDADRMIIDRADKSSNENAVSDIDFPLEMVRIK